jgi:hypothetical protein
MSAEALARFDAETARMKRVVEAEQARRRKTQPEPVVEITIEITTEPKPS